MKSLSVRLSVAALAVLVAVAFAACMNPVAGSAKSDALSVSSSNLKSSRALTAATSIEKGTGRIVCDAFITYDSSPGIDDPHWIGTLKGGALDGAKIEFWEKSDNYLAGKTEHFFEKMLITIGGDTISGDDAGVWNFSTFKFRANGRVTDATGPWAYLVGYKMHEMGFTTEVPPPEGTYVINGTATFWLAP